MRSIWLTRGWSCWAAAVVLGWMVTLAVMAVPASGSEEEEEDRRVPLGAIFETAVNCGSLENYTDVDGVVFGADTFHAANRDSTRRAIADTEDGVLYQSTAWSRTSIVYNISLAESADAVYLVELHFAEIWDGAFAAGVRLFDVLVERKEVATDLDVFAAAGALTPLILTVQVMVQDGALTIELDPVQQHPKLNAFAIWRLGSLAPPLLPSLVGPSTSFHIVGPGVATDPLVVTVTFVDDVGIDVSSLSVADLLFVSSDGRDMEVLSFASAPLSEDGKTVSATWNVRPVGGTWATTLSISPTLHIRILENAVLDVKGNGNFEESASTAISFVREDGPPTVPSTPNPVLVRAVNCGGPQFTSRDDIVYEADTFDNGRAYSVTDEIGFTNDDVLYQSERWRKKGFTYIVPVDEEDGDYLVVMEFAEIFHETPGQRIFALQVQGLTVEPELDVLKRAGGRFQALTLETEVRVTDGRLNITTIAITQNPQMSAFSIWRLPSGRSPAGPPLGTPPSPAELAFLLSSARIDTTDVPEPGAQGSARLAILRGENRVQRSNFNAGSFVLRNTGQLRIAAVFIDVTTAILPDIVFDDDGTGGDSVAKPLVYDDGAAETGALPESDYVAYWLPARDDPLFDHTKEFDAEALEDEWNLFVDETSNTHRGTPAAGGGYRGLLLLFTDFDPDEVVRFSLDMDPNSLAGLDKASVQRGSVEVTAKPGLLFDAGGVSGAEMMCGVVTVLYGDGSQAEGTIASDGSQAGAVAVVPPAPLRPPPGLTVSGLEPGDFGTYGIFRPVVRTAGQPGDRIRVIMMKAMNPVGNDEEWVGSVSVETLVEARLNATGPEFPVNNAVEVQNEIVTLEAQEADLSARFRYHVVAEPRDAASPFDGHDTLALAFVAVIIDSKGRPLSYTTEPIRLVNRGGAVDGFT